MFKNGFYRWELPYKKSSLTYFECIKDRYMSCFLDSCCDYLPVNQYGRFDIMSSDPVQSLSIISEDNQLIIHDHDRKSKILKPADITIFDTLREVLDTIQPTPHHDLPFSSGLLGFWSYELGGILEPKSLLRCKSNIPLMHVGLYVWSLVTDHIEQKTWLLIDVNASEYLKKTIKTIFSRTPENNIRCFSINSKINPCGNFNAYKKSFQKIQHYIRNGDCYQVNLTKRFYMEFSGDTWSAYCHIRKKNPAAYSAYLNFPGISILCFSPEQFMHVNRSGYVETRPIKGTSARGKNEEQDRISAENLLNSEKDKAENIMIVDLLRNDLAKVCKNNTISIPYTFKLQSNLYVHHLVSSVTGQLTSDHNAFDLMQHCFPGGSITGCPKIRAMQIIQELETSIRGVYCGSIGYFNSNQCMNMNIAIRTSYLRDNILICSGGGAITVDSDCQLEYNESVTKISGILEVLVNSQKNTPA